MSEDLKRKLCSRKLWVAVAGFVCAAAALFGVSESVFAQISATVMAGGIVIAYIFGESLVDMNRK